MLVKRRGYLHIHFRLSFLFWLRCGDFLRLLNIFLSFSLRYKSASLEAFRCFWNSRTLGFFLLFALFWHFKIRLKEIRVCTGFLVLCSRSLVSHRILSLYYTCFAWCLVFGSRSCGLSCLPRFRWLAPYSFLCLHLKLYVNDLFWPQIYFDYI